MGSNMLIDASHPEETRVVVARGNRIEEFDYESASRKQLKGNIYLAKVTRVEPSLQAAFVDYGGNRHGFLAFSEIHPDYYQIPVADRQALLREEEDEARRSDEEEDRDVRGRNGNGANGSRPGSGEEASSEGADETDEALSRGRRNWKPPPSLTRRPPTKRPPPAARWRPSRRRARPSNPSARRMRSRKSRSGAVAPGASTRSRRSSSAAR